MRSPRYLPCTGHQRVANGIQWILRTQFIPDSLLTDKVCGPPIAESLSEVADWSHNLPAAPASPEVSRAAKQHNPEYGRSPSQDDMANETGAHPDLAPLQGSILWQSFDGV